jgi:hypothetical protein
MLSTATGTGAAATGIFVNVPGILKTRLAIKIYEQLFIRNPSEI